MASNLKKLQDRQAALVAAMRGLANTATADERSLSDDEQSAYEAHKGELADVKTELAREEELQELERSLVSQSAGRPDPHGQPDESRQAAEGKPPKEDPTRFATFGDQLMAVMAASRPGGYVDPRLCPQASISGSGTTLGDDGGFLAQQDFSTELLKRTYEQGSLLAKVRKVPLSAGKDGIKINAIDETSRATGSRWGGVQVYRVEQGGQYTASRPKMRQIVLSLKKLIGLWYATDELMSDAVAMEAVAKDAFAEEFVFKLEDELINGTGAGDMLGILASDCTVSVAKESGQAADTICKENIDKMWSRCWARSRMNACWFINQTVEPQLSGLTQVVGTGGCPVYLPPGGLSAQPYGQLYGLPVIPIEQCAKLGDVGDIILGDFSQYVMIDEGAPEIASSIHLRFDYGEQVFRWTMRNDGKPIWNSPLTPYKGGSGATLSPFVTLAAR